MVSILISVFSLTVYTTDIWSDPNNKWDYRLGGSDWSKNTVLRVNQCGSPLAQSPVDIPSTARNENSKVTIQWNDVDQVVPIKFKEGSFYSPGDFSTIKLKTQYGLDIHY